MIFSQKHILDYYKHLPNKESLTYLSTHAKRYAFLLNLLTKIRNTIKEKKITITDIGPSFLTEQIQNAFNNDIVYSLGYSHPESRGGHLPEVVKLREDCIIHFDLNDVQHREKWISVPACKIVVLAEVIEHLYTVPSLILQFISTFLDKDGIVIIQTPNAVSLYNRIKILCGHNPFDMIRENNQNPGHFREYTKKELCTLAEENNYEIVDFIYSNYFDVEFVNFKIIMYKALQFVLGKSFYNGMTIILKKK